LCLLLTLLLVPVAYVKLDGLEQAMVNQRWKAFAARVHASTFGRFRPGMAKG